MKIFKTSCTVLPNHLLHNEAGGGCLCLLQHFLVVHWSGTPLSVPTTFIAYNY